MLKAFLLPFGAPGFVPPRILQGIRHCGLLAAAAPRPRTASSAEV
jgi:hypothetical protein